MGCRPSVSTRPPVRPVIRYAEGVEEFRAPSVMVRRCATEGCRTRLAAMNGGKLCFVCQAEANRSKLRGEAYLRYQVKLAGRRLNFDVDKDWGELG